MPHGEFWMCSCWRSGRSSSFLYLCRQKESSIGLTNFIRDFMKIVFNVRNGICFSGWKRKGLSFLFLCMAGSVFAQTDVSLFWKKEGKQLPEVISLEADQYKKIGHHGPAVENKYMALRIYYNNSGAIDVYSKSGEHMELAKFKWYTTKDDQAEGYGCDEYRVGKTVGLGGIGLWDGEKVVKLVATRGRDARVGKNRKGAFAEMLSKGVPYRGDTVDILVRVNMFNDSRDAEIAAFCTSGQKVQFLTGVNYHPGQQLDYGNGYIGVWGIHPADVSQHPIPIGGGMRYQPKDMLRQDKTADMIQLISRPAKKLKTKVVSASIKEGAICTPELFFEYVKSMK